MAEEALEVRKQVLNAIEVQMVTYLSGLEHLQPELRWRYADNAARNMAAQLRAYVYCADKAARTISYPETWWDAFKVRWFPAWLLKWSPAQRRMITLSAKALLPDVPFEGRERVVYVLDEESALQMYAPHQLRAGEGV